MNTPKNITIWLLLVLTITGCSSMSKVRIDPQASQTTRCTALSTEYTRSYFQARFMGPAIVASVLFGPIVAGTLQDARHYDGDRHLAKNANPYEAKLGELDTNIYFAQTLSKELATSKTVKFVFTDNVQSGAAIVGLIKGQASSSKFITDDKSDAHYDCVAAFRLIYGLGPRQGPEQFGFRKTYRPYMRVIGSVKHLPTNTIIWQDEAIVFSEKKYVGSEADPENIPSEELQEAMKAVSLQTASIISKSLAGDPQKDPPELFNSAREDFEF